MLTLFLNFLRHLCFKVIRAPFLMLSIEKVGFFCRQRLGSPQNMHIAKALSPRCLRDSLLPANMEGRHYFGWSTSSFAFTNLTRPRRVFLSLPGDARSNYSCHKEVPYLSLFRTQPSAGQDVFTGVSETGWFSAFWPVCFPSLCVNALPLLTV